MSGIDTVVDVLEENGYVRLSKPLTVAGTEFDFEAAVSGTEKSQDLVIVATGEVPPRRLLRLVAVLARSLDVAHSRRPVTVLFLGDLAAADRSELERTARVLTLESTSPSVDEVKQAAAVLLPLTLPTLSVAGSDPLDEALAALGPKVTDEHRLLVRAAVNGPDRVRRTLHDFVDAAIPEEAAIDG